MITRAHRNAGLALGAAVLLLAVHAVAATHYVSLSSTNPVPPYTNWVTAATNIQDAVNVAWDGETVVVSNGTYLLSTQIVVTNEVLLQSLAGAVTTIIDGNLSTRCLSLDNGAALDGFTITRGRNTMGAGVFADHGSAVLNCSIVSNSANGPAGGGAYVPGGAGYGGGIYCDHGSLVENCDLAANTADGGAGGGPGGNGGDGHGGGVFSDNSSTVRVCTIRGNTGNGGAAGYTTAMGTSDGGSGFGGGVYLSNGSRVEHCGVSNNTAYGQNGGGSFAAGTGSGGDGHGGGVYACNTSAVRSCSITSNSTMAGGAVGPQPPPWGDCCGGGVYAVNQSSVEECSIRGNAALTGEIFSYRIAGTGGGLGLAAASRAVNCLVVDNGNGGVHCESSVLQNSTVAGNTCQPPPSAAGVEACTNSAVVNVISCFNQCSDWTGSGFSYSCTAPAPSGAGNITNDPRFVNAAAGNYHLLTNSPCVDTGTNLTAAGITNDFDGVARPQDGNGDGTNEFDMGCYEGGNPGADADGDGLNDYQETSIYRTGPLNPDTDGDSQNDGGEVQAGTDALDDSSFLGMNGVWWPVSGGTGFVVRWSSATDRYYRVMRGTNLMDGFGHVVESNIPATPTLNVYTDETAVGPSLFYRIDLESPP